jgi:hypothetical protein
MRPLLVALALSACTPPEAQVVRLELNGAVPFEELTRGTLQRWDAAPLLTVTGSVELPAGQTALPDLELLVDDTRARFENLPFVRLGVAQSIAVTSQVALPMLPLGDHRVNVTVRSAGEEVARWGVRRTVIDPGLTVCVADQPPEVEDASAPLTRCRTLAGGDVAALPFEATEAVVRKRVSLSVRQGSITVQSTPCSFTQPTCDETTLLWAALAAPTAAERAAQFAAVRQPRTVLPEAPLELVVDPTTSTALGNTPLQPTRLRSRSLVDRNPRPPLLRVRRGTSFEVVRDVSSTAGPLELVSFEDPLGELSLGDPLPVRLDPAVTTGLKVRFSPGSSTGPRGVAVLRLRDATGLVRTDRLPFNVDGLSAASCVLAIGEVDVGAVQVGGEKRLTFPVQNVSADACSRARATFPAGSPAVLLSSPIPGPGQTSLWSLQYTPQRAGPQVELLSVFFDDAQPTAADLEVRVNANPTP